VTRTSTNTTPKRTAIYCRISDDRHDDELGVKRQEKLCRALTRRLGWDVVEPPYTDNDISASSGRRRPNWERLVADIKAGRVDGLVAVHPDRFTRSDLRNLEDLIDLLDAHDVAVETVKAGRYDLKTASGRMNARIVGSVARGESERMSERIRDKMSELAQAGKYHGGPAPYGYRYERGSDGRPLRGAPLQVVQGEAAVIVEVAERIIDGWSLRRICGDLNDRGIPTRKGGPWTAAVVRAVITRPTVIGWRSHRGEMVAQGEWDPILDRRTWERACAVLADPARKTTRPGRRYLLAGLIQTASGDKMAGRPRHRSDEANYEGPGTSITVSRTDAEVMARLWEHLSTLRTLPRRTDDAADAARAQIDAAEAELRELAERRQRREIEQVEYEVFAAPIRARLVEARKVRVAARGPDLRAMAASPADLRRRWDDLSLVEQREALSGFVERVVIGPRTLPAGSPFDPDRITVVWR
jgi:DNA invertase Pin-like site-specific DNA recombinase